MSFLCNLTFLCDTTFEITFKSITYSLTWYSLLLHLCIPPPHCIAYVGQIRPKLKKILWKKMNFEIAFLADMPSYLSAYLKVAFLAVFFYVFFFLLKHTFLCVLLTNRTDLSLHNEPSSSLTQEWIKMLKFKGKTLTLPPPPRMNPLTVILLQVVWIEFPHLFFLMVRNWTLIKQTGRWGGFASSTTKTQWNQWEVETQVHPL